MNIRVCDSIMGSGKTTATLDLINKSSNDKKFIFVTPYLTEVNRVKTECKDKNFKEPDDTFTKLASLKELVKQGENIVTTHVLFESFDKATIELFKETNYILILDEVVDVIEPMRIRKGDQDVLIQTDVLRIDENNRVTKGDNDEYVKNKGTYSRIVRMAETERLIRIKDSMFMWDFPIEVFTIFDSVFILTYMFDCQLQKYYFDANGIKYEYWHSKKENDKYTLCKGRNKGSDWNIRSKIKERISIYDGDLNNIGKTKTALSNNWYLKSNKKKKTDLRLNIQNYYKHITKSKSSEFLWTTFKDHKKHLIDKGYKSEDKIIEDIDGNVIIERSPFCALNVRATNDYADRTNVVYGINLFMNPYLVAYFDERDIKVDQDAWSLSEMIQWIWRSAIRNDENINIYIPSKRMRDLLIEWLEVEEFDILEVFEDSQHIEADEEVFDMFDPEAKYF